MLRCIFFLLCAAHAAVDYSKMWNTFDKNLCQTKTYTAGIMYFNYFHQPYLTGTSSDDGKYLCKINECIPSHKHSSLKKRVYEYVMWTPRIWFAYPDVRVMAASSSTKALPMSYNQFGVRFAFEFMPTKKGHYHFKFVCYAMYLKFYMMGVKMSDRFLPMGTKLGEWGSFSEPQLQGILDDDLGATFAEIDLVDVNTKLKCYTAKGGIRDINCVTKQAMYLSVNGSYPMIFDVENTNPKATAYPCETEATCQKRYTVGMAYKHEDDVTWQFINTDVTRIPDYVTDAEAKMLNRNYVSKVTLPSTDPAKLPEQFFKPPLAFREWSNPTLCKKRYLEIKCGVNENVLSQYGRIDMNKDWKLNKMDYAEIQYTDIKDYQIPGKDKGRYTCAKLSERNQPCYEYKDLEYQLTYLTTMQQHPETGSILPKKIVSPLEACTYCGGGRITQDGNPDLKSVRNPIEMNKMPLTCTRCLPGTTKNPEKWLVDSDTATIICKNIDTCVSKAVAGHKYTVLDVHGWTSKTIPYVAKRWTTRVHFTCAVPNREDFIPHSQAFPIPWTNTVITTKSSWGNVFPIPGDNHTTWKDCSKEATSKQVTCESHNYNRAILAMFQLGGCATTYDELPYSDPKWGGITSGQAHLAMDIVYQECKKKSSFCKTHTSCTDLNAHKYLSMLYLLQVGSIGTDLLSHDDICKIPITGLVGSVRDIVPKSYELRKYKTHPHACAARPIGAFLLWEAGPEIKTIAVPFNNKGKGNLMVGASSTGSVTYYPTINSAHIGPKSCAQGTAYVPGLKKCKFTNYKDGELTLDGTAMCSDNCITCAAGSYTKHGYSDWFVQVKSGVASFRGCKKNDDCSVPVDVDDAFNVQCYKNVADKVSPGSRAINGWMTLADWNKHKDVLQPWDYESEGRCMANPDLRLPTPKTITCQKCPGTTFSGTGAIACQEMTVCDERTQVRREYIYRRDGYPDTTQYRCVPKWAFIAADGKWSPNTIIAKGSDLALSMAGLGSCRAHMAVVFGKSPHYYSAKDCEAKKFPSGAQKCLNYKYVAGNGGKMSFCLCMTESPQTAHTPCRGHNKIGEKIPRGHANVPICSGCSETREKPISLAHQIQCSAGTYADLGVAPIIGEFCLARVGNDDLSFNRAQCLHPNGNSIMQGDWNVKCVSLGTDATMEAADHTIPWGNAPYPAVGEIQLGVCMVYATRKLSIAVPPTVPCLPCPHNKYNPLKGQGACTDCKSCGAKKLVTPCGGVAPGECGGVDVHSLETKCTDGRSVWQPLKIVECVPCKGYSSYLDVKNNACVGCPVGRTAIKEQPTIAERLPIYKEIGCPAATKTTIKTTSDIFETCQNAQGFKLLAVAKRCGPTAVAVTIVRSADLLGILQKCSAFATTSGAVFFSVDTSAIGTCRVYKYCTDLKYSPRVGQYERVYEVIQDWNAIRNARQECGIPIKECLGLEESRLVTTVDNVRLHKWSAFHEPSTPPCFECPQYHKRLSTSIWAKCTPIKTCTAGWYKAHDFEKSADPDVCYKCPSGRFTLSEFAHISGHYQGITSCALCSEENTKIVSCPRYALNGMCGGQIAQETGLGIFGEGSYYCKFCPYGQGPHRHMETVQRANWGQDMTMLGIHVATLHYDTCMVCPGGYESVVANTPNDIKKYFNNSGIIAGYYCRMCGENTASIGGTVPCTQCDVNAVWPTPPGSTVCTQCPQGYEMKKSATTSIANVKIPTSRAIDERAILAKYGVNPYQFESVEWSILSIALTSKIMPMLYFQKPSDATNVNTTCTQKVCPAGFGIDGKGTIKTKLHQECNSTAQCGTTDILDATKRANALGLTSTSMSQLSSLTNIDLQCDKGMCRPLSCRQNSDCGLLGSKTPVGADRQCSSGSYLFCAPSIIDNKPADQFGADGTMFNWRSRSLNETGTGFCAVCSPDLSSRDPNGNRLDEFTTIHGKNSDNIKVWEAFDDLRYYAYRPCGNAKATIPIIGNAAKAPPYDNFCGFGNDKTCKEGARLQCTGDEDTEKRCRPCTDFIDRLVAQPFQGWSECLPCKFGYHNDGTNSQCQLCPNNTVSYAPMSNHIAFTKCGKCDNSTIVKNGAFCSLCGSTSVPDPSGQMKCIACPTGTAKIVETDMTCSYCNAGYISDNGLAYDNRGDPIKCTACERGKFNGDIGGKNCTNAWRGHYVPFAGMTEPIPCPLGHYSDTTGAAECQQCPTGTCTLQPGSVVCQGAKEKGRTLASDNIGPVYTKAQDGRFIVQKDFLGDCKFVDCPPGTYNDGHTGGKCEPAAKGYYVNNWGSDMQHKCKPGTYAPRTGMVDCLSCGIGLVTNREKPVPGAQDCIQKCQDNPNWMARAALPGAFTPNEGPLCLQNECPSCCQSKNNSCLLPISDSKVEKHKFPKSDLFGLIMPPAEAGGTLLCFIVTSSVMLYSINNAWYTVTTYVCVSVPFVILTLWGTSMFPDESWAFITCLVIFSVAAPFLLMVVIKYCAKNETEQSVQDDETEIEPLKPTTLRFRKHATRKHLD